MIGLIRSMVSMLALFSSLSTLVCCALPALFISLGAGATLAGLVSAMPQLVWLSQHKVPLFGIAAFLLTISGALQYRSHKAPCPANLEKAKACHRLRRISLGVFYFAVAMYVMGFFFAFVAYRFA